MSRRVLDEGHVGCISFTLLVRETSERYHGYFACFVFFFFFYVAG